jgi:hypothetical protein
MQSGFETTPVKWQVFCTLKYHFTRFFADPAALERIFCLSASNVTV